MTNVAPPSAPRNIPGPGLTLVPPINPPFSRSNRSGQSGLDVLSPVGQNGSFEFDRIIKEGEVLKRTRKTKVRYDLWIVWRGIPLIRDSHGSPFTLSCDRTYYQHTATRTKRSFDIKSPFLTLQQLRDKKTLSVKKRQYSPSSRLHEITTSRRNRIKMQKNGSN